jgi:hypothetical protein
MMGKVQALDVEDLRPLLIRRIPRQFYASYIWSTYSRRLTSYASLDAVTVPIEISHSKCPSMCQSGVR